MFNAGFRLPGVQIIPGVPVDDTGFYLVFSDDARLVFSDDAYLYFGV